MLFLERKLGFGNFMRKEQNRDEQIGGVGELCWQIW